MSAPQTPDPVPNPYAERPLDDDSAGALAALLFDSPVEGAGQTGGPRPPVSHPADIIGDTTLSQQVGPAAAGGPPPFENPVGLEPSTPLFSTIEGGGPDDVVGQRLSANRPLFDGLTEPEPDQPASLRWSTVVHEPTVAEMGSAPAEPGRRLFLEDAPTVSASPQLVPASTGRFGGGSSALGDLIDGRWLWFTVASVAALVVGFVGFTIVSSSDNGAFPSLSAQADDGDASESAADTVPAGPALAANDDGGNTASFKGSSTSTADPTTTLTQRVTRATTTVAPSSTVTTPSSSSSTSDPSSTTTTRSTTTTASSTTASSTSTSQATTTSTTASTTTSTTPSSSTTTTTASSTSTSQTTTSSTTTSSSTTSSSTTEATSSTSDGGPPP